MEKKDQHETAMEAARPASKFSKGGSRGYQARVAGASISASDIEDETGGIAAKALSYGDPEPEKSSRVLRKLDTYILPCLCITYSLQFMDKSSLSYSSVYGIIQDTHLTGQDYSWASSIFFFGFMLAQYPGMAIMQRFPIAKFLGYSIVIWGFALMATAASSSFARLAAARFVLGMAEAAITPGFVAMTSIWWTRREQAGRSALWLSFLGVGGFVGSLAIFGVGHIHGSLSSWRYIFLILGSVTVMWGFVFLFFVPDGPAQVRWLSADEKVVAVQRVIENRMGTKSRRFVKAQVVEALTDPKVIVLGLLQLVIATAAGGFSFGPLIISGFGFDPLQTTLMMLPYTAVQVISQLGCGLLTSKIPNSRLQIAGTILISQLPTENKWGRVTGFWILGFHPVVFTIALGLLGTNIAGSTKRSVALGWSFVSFGVGNIAGPHFFKSSEAPVYQSGIISMLCSFVLALILAQILRLMCVAENKKRNRELARRSPDEIVELKRIGDRQGFEDVTDKENVMFRYAL